MDFGEAIKKPFLDIKKTILLSVLSLVPVVNFFAIGYILEVVRGMEQVNIAAGMG